MESSFLELKCKQVINVVDGKCLGRVLDIVFDCCYGRVLGIVVPDPQKSFFSFFRGCKDIFIPYQAICKIGADAILVEIITHNLLNPPCNTKRRGGVCAQNNPLSGGQQTPIALNNVEQ